MNRSKWHPGFPGGASAVSTLLLVLTVFAVFALGPAPARAAFATVHSFAGWPPDGSTSYGALVFDPASGNYYGTTRSGGANGLGVIFQMTPAFVVNIIHNFGGPGGAEPTCTLWVKPVAGGVSWLYGTTLRGGAANLGTVFRIHTNGANFLVLHNFAGAPDGANPWAGVILASDGRLYGTTLFGGAGFGITYGIKPTGAAYVVTHAFAVAAGANPYARLFEYQVGSVAGTVANGAGGFGAVFTETLAGAAFGLIHVFGPPPDGEHPRSEVIPIIAPTGLMNLWGTTFDGGGKAAGAIYSLTPLGAGYVIQYNFLGGPGDGANPWGALFLSPVTGDIYGTTVNGGPFGLGTVYIANPAIAPPPIPEGLKYGFTINDGWNPYAALIPDPAGIPLYSTTANGGVFLEGTIFSQTP